MRGAEEGQGCTATSVDAAGLSVHCGEHQLCGDAAVFLGTICAKAGLALLLTGDFWTVLQPPGS